MKKKRAFCAFLTILAVAALLILHCSAAVDWSEYPNSNLLPLPYVFGAPGQTLYRNGLTISVLEDGRIHVEGTSTGSTVLILANIYDFDFGTDYYYDVHYDVAPASGSFYVDCYRSGGGYPSTSISRGRFVPVSGPRYQFYCEVNSGYTVDFTFDVTLNHWAAGFPYQPYIPFYLENAGDLNAWNIFKYSTYETVILESDYNGQTRQTVSWDPTLFVGGLSFASMYTAVSPLVDDDILDSITTTITFPSGQYLSYEDCPLYVSANTAYTYMWPAFRLITPSGTLYNTTIEQQDDGRYKIVISDPISSYPLYISGVVVVSTSSPSIYQTMTLYNSAYQYNSGYAAGYNDGLVDSNNEAYSAGKTDGYKNGYIAGKADGLSMSETGNWRALISAVIEAPVNTFQSLFNFEILGMNMQSAIGAVLALCVILIIIKKVIL